MRALPFLPLLSSLLLFITPVARAADGDGVDPSCSSNDLPQNGLNACAYQRYQAADKMLNTVYAKVAASEDAVGKPLLKRAEVAWIAYRDAECALEADAFRGGSAAPMLENACLERLTKAQTASLQGSMAEPGE